MMFAMILILIIIVIINLVKQNKNYELCKKCDRIVDDVSANTDDNDLFIEDKWDENQTKKIANELWKDFLTDGGFVHHQMII